ncbi:MAG: hypothetical protein Q7S40_05240 [Opitutaceae bacterium]|nr:hypothetical protein [Opitutaceae bacterium]
MPPNHENSRRHVKWRGEPRSRFLPLASPAGARRIAVITLFAAAASAVFAADAVRIVGTDLLGVEFSKALYEYSGRSQLRIVLALDGSRPALEELKTNRADVALLVLPEGETEPLAACDTLVLGYHPIVILSPAACPLANVGMDQLAAVFGAGSKSVRWAEFGAAAGWAKDPVELWVAETGVGLAPELFKQAVLDGRGFRPGIRRYADQAELGALFGETSRVLVIASSVPAAGMRAKVLAVSRRAFEPAALPTAAALHDGSYPLRLTLRLAVRREVAARLTPLVAMLVGDAGAVVLDRSGWVPLPPSVRAQQVLVWSRR